ncbi:hypothetical protein QA645_32265 [Bradyrhizobium sp. CIAT3101]|uniref:hypothetical protein n=1 Tax=Bradyrhizobium sp. CIAT3101 TaxID=439387 RepID=UPI0024B1A986|nr:hypothetical protein [Bradyrhizobium sp. CIAT3101]WFU79172.1 hypothetical protein QA645_32265 [Bradyrhizobium sp. CIAT3101]
MLRMMLLGLLIPLCMGVLSAMELRTPPCSAIAIVPPPKPSQDISESHGVLAKADRLEVAALSSERPVQFASVDERIAPPENIGMGSLEPARPVSRQRPSPKKVTTAVHPKSEAKAAAMKRTAIVQPSKAGGDTEPCRLKAFGGLRKALNSTGCEI